MRFFDLCVRCFVYNTTKLIDAITIQQCAKLQSDKLISLSIRSSSSVNKFLPLLHLSPVFFNRNYISIYKIAAHSKEKEHNSFSAHAHIAANYLYLLFSPLLYFLLLIRSIRPSLMNQVSVCVCSEITFVGGSRGVSESLSALSLYTIYILPLWRRSSSFDLNWNARAVRESFSLIAWSGSPAWFFVSRLNCIRISERERERWCALTERVVMNVLICRDYTCLCCFYNNTRVYIPACGLYICMFICASG